MIRKGTSIIKFVHISTDELEKAKKDKEKEKQQQMKKDNDKNNNNKGKDGKNKNSINKLTNGPYQFPEKLIPLIILNCLKIKRPIRWGWIKC